MTLASPDTPNLIRGRFFFGGRRTKRNRRLRGGEEMSSLHSRGIELPHIRTHPSGEATQ